MIAAVAAPGASAVPGPRAPRSNGAGAPRAALQLGLLALAWTTLVAAAPPPVPVELPLPDLTFVVPFAAAALDKPAIVVPVPPAPDSPYPIPELPPPRLVLDWTQLKPTAPLPTAECKDLLARLGRTTALIECGRFRFEIAEYDRAVELLEEGLGKAPGPGEARRARYVLAESLYRLNRILQADRAYERVYREGSGDELGAFAQNASGYTALRLGDTQRALAAFEGVLKREDLSSRQLVGSARYGRALALSFLGRHEDARQAWARLLDDATPSAAREARFWLGESLARLREYAAAAEELGRFAAGGAHPLLDTGLLRLGWWQTEVGHLAEAVKSYRQVLENAGAFPERDWAHLGLVQALLGLDDWAGARQAVKPLQERTSPLVLPALFAMARFIAQRNPVAAHAFDQELLSRSLSSRDRAWVLFLEGEVFRQEGNQDEARTRYDQARQNDPGSRLGWLARLRLAQLNFEFREFAQAQADATALLAQPIPSEFRAPALLLAGEGAYYAGEYDGAAGAFRRFLGEFRTHPAAPAAMYSVGWAELKRGNGAEARTAFADFARDLPDNQYAADALSLAAEQAAGAGDSASALDLLDRVLDRYPAHPRADLVRLNRAILLLRAGRPRDAQPLLHDFLNRAPTSPLLGRAHLALGVALLASRHPAEAREEFAAARREGEGAEAQLGLGVAALELKSWEDAARAFADARESGSPAVTEAAEYGLAVAAFGRRDREGYRKAATAPIRSGREAPALLYGLVVTAVEAQAWQEALDTAKRLVKEFPADTRADSGLVRVGLGAAAARNWPIANEALALLREQFKQSQFLDEVFMLAVEAMIETGALADARGALEKFVQGPSPRDPRLPRAWFLLARLREETGDRARAIEAYQRAAKDGQGAEWTLPVRFRYVRLLVEEKRWKEARPELDRIIKGEAAAAAGEAAFYKGESYRVEGNPSGAVEYYMTAVYLDPASLFGRRALLAAAASYIALKQPELAAIAYQKLLAQPDLPPEMAQLAQAGLSALGTR